MGRVFLIFFFVSASGLAAYRPPDLKPIPAQTFKSDPLAKSMWHLDSIRVRSAWNRTEGAPSTRIAVIDSGVDYNHPDLATNIYRKAKELPINGVDKDSNGYKDDIIGWDYVRNSPLPFDKTGHGTFMASIIAAIKDNGEGGTGICPHCSLMPLRFINGEGLGDTEDAIKAIYYAAREGVSAINISFAGEGYDKDLEKAIEFAGSKDVVVIVSAGNDEENLDYAATYPAKFQMPHLLTVAASDPEDKLMEGSNWGKKTVSLLAPGEDLLGIWLGKYDQGSGTSESAAVVTGVVGLVRSANPKLSANQVAKILRKTVRKVPGLDKHCQTGGVVDAEKAVACALDPGLSCL